MKNSNQEISRPIVEKSLEIKHNFNDLSKLTLTLELAKLLEDNGCNDFIEVPNKKYLLKISSKRF